MGVSVVNPFILVPPAPPFDPTDLAGLAFWLRTGVGYFQDMTRTTPAGANNDPAGAWADQSGVGNDVLQATSGARPLVKTNLINGLSGLRFDGSDDFLASLTFARAQPSYLFLVHRTTGSPSNGYVADGLVVNTAAHSADAFVAHAFAGAGLNDGTVDMTSFKVVGIRFNGGSSVMTVGASATSGNLGSSSASGLTLGGSPLGQPFAGDIIEVFGGNALLSNSEHNAATGYLATLTGLVGSAL